MILIHDGIMAEKRFPNQSVALTDENLLMDSPHKVPGVWSFFYIINLHELLNKQLTDRWLKTPWLSYDITAVNHTLYWHIWDEFHTDFMSSLSKLVKITVSLSRKKITSSHIFTHVTIAGLLWHEIVEITIRAKLIFKKFPSWSH